MSLFDFSEQCYKDLLHNLPHNYLILLIDTLLANNIDIIKMNKYILRQTQLSCIYNNL